MIFAWIHHRSNVIDIMKCHSWPAASLLFRLGRCLYTPRMSGHLVHWEFKKKSLFLFFFKSIENQRGIFSKILLLIIWNRMRPIERFCRINKQRELIVLEQLTSHFERRPTTTETRVAYIWHAINTRYIHPHQGDILMFLFWSLRPVGQNTFFRRLVL